MSDKGESNEPEVVTRLEQFEKEGKAEATNTVVLADIAAQISQYTDRPDLLLEVLEKHDAGFIKEMNQSAKMHSEKLRDSKFNFGRTQAYTTLGIQIVAALVAIGAICFVAVKGLGFGSLIALIIFYAVSQGGLDTFMQIAKGVKRLIETFKSGSNNNST